MDEPALIRNLKKGSHAAFDEIYSMYFDRLYGYAYRFCGSREDSEEIIHNVFLRLWRIRQKIKKEDSLEPLLFVITKSYLLKFVSRRKNNLNIEDLLGQDNTPIDSSDLPDFNLSHEIIRTIIQEELSHLPKTQQRIIILSRFDSLTNREIAQALNLKEQTVRNQLSLGLKELKRRLKTKNINLD